MHERCWEVTGWRGAVQILAPCPRLNGSCLDLASPTRGRHLAAFTCSLSAGRTLPLLAGIACNNNNNNDNARCWEVTGADGSLDDASIHGALVVVGVQFVAAVPAGGCVAERQEAEVSQDAGILGAPLQRRLHRSIRDKVLGSPLQQHTRESITAAPILVIVPFQIWNAKMPDPNMTALPDKQRDFRFSEALAILS